ncbi:WD40 repeat domain-containing protein [Planctomycetota bacterium]
MAIDLDRCIVAYDVQSGQKLSEFPTLQKSRHNSEKLWWGGETMLRLNPDGQKISLKSLSVHGVQIWDRKSGSLLYTIPEGKASIFGLSWSPDGQRLAVSRSNSDIEIWNLAVIEEVLSNLGLAP